MCDKMKICVKEMKIGLQIPYFNYQDGTELISPKLADIVQTADKNDFYSIWVMDHFFQIPHVGPADDPMLEAYTTLGYIAAHTKKAKLGTMVTGVVYRQPGFLIKAVSTLDVLSLGRAYLGIGAAWYEREAHGLGFPFPSVKERFEMLEETLQIAKKMWSDDPTPFKGKHFTLQEPLNRPQPLTKPHPPILIGGMGEKKTLRLVAQYADACNLFLFAGTEVLKHKLAVLENHCKTVGRNYDEIEKTTLGSVNLSKNGMSASDIVKICKNLSDIGIEHAIFNMRNAHEITPLERFGEEIIPAVADF